MVRFSWGSRSQRLVAAAATIALLAGAFVAIASDEEPDRRRSRSLVDESDELGVEVISKRTETSKTFETDTPGHFNAQLFAAPVHYKDEANEWEDIDTTARKLPNGRFGTDDVAQPVSFAPLGSDATLATIELDDAHSVSFGFTGGRAVAAKQSGSSVLYTDILPGVTAAFTAHNRGIKETLTLASPTTARNFDFPIFLQGLTASQDVVTGDVVYSDEAGTERGRTPHGYMFDSAVDKDSGQPAYSGAVTYALVRGPAGGTVLRVALDDAWLDDPARVWPVTVDPPFGPQTTTDDTFVQDEYPSNGYYQNVELRSGTFNGGVDRVKSFLKFDTSTLNNATINSATLQLYNEHSYQCSPREVTISRVTETWSGTTANWPGPAYADVVDAKSFAWGHAGCDTDGEFVTFNVRSAVQNWASGLWSPYGLAITTNESDSYSWKKFTSAEGTPGYRPNIVADYTTGGSNTAPTGALDSATGQQGRIRVQGWAYDAQAGQNPIQVHVYVGSNPPVGLLANGQRTDVNLVHPGWGDYHGFDQLITAAAGTYNVCAYAINVPNGTNPQLASCRTATVTAPTTPTKPLSVTATADNDGTVALSWSPPSSDGGADIDSYLVYPFNPSTNQWVTAKGSVTVSCANGAPCRSATYTGLDPGTSYGFKVKAHNSVNNGPLSDLSNSVTPFTNPSAPRNAAVTFSNTTGTITWEEPTSTNGSPIDLYTIWNYVYNAQTGVWDYGTSVTAQQNERSKTWPNILPQKQYYFRVNAHNAAGYSVFAQTNTINTSAPSAPTNVTAAAQPDGTVRIQWTASTTNGGAAIKEYVVTAYEGSTAAATFTTPCGPCTVVDFPSSATPTNPSTTLLLGHQYTFKVGARNTALLLGSQSSATTPAVTAATPPSAPPSATAEATGTTSVAVSWTPSSSSNGQNIDGYRIRVYTSNDQEVGTPVTVCVGCSPKTIGGLTAATTYYFTVEAHNAMGYSGAARTANVTTLPPPVGTPTVLSPSPNTWQASRNVTFTWQAPTGGAPIVGYHYKFDSDEATGVTTANPSTALPTRSEEDVTDGERYLHVAAKDSYGTLGPAGHFRVRVDGTPPTAPATWPTKPAWVGHDPATWYSDGSPTFTFAASDISGISGYSYRLDKQSSPEPDTIADSVSGQASYSNLADGEWTFQVRAANGATPPGWSSSGTVTARLDRTPPTGVTGLESRSHPVNDPTSNASVKLTWDAGADATAGVAGYSYSFSSSSTGNPGTSVDTTATTITQTQPAGTWWFRIATIDAAGNASEPATFGPIVIDSAAPPVPVSETNKFISLWAPRVQDEVFLETWRATTTIPVDIEDEGFHGGPKFQPLTVQQQSFLADRLRAEFTPDTDDATPYLRELLYRVVFEKAALANATFEDATTEPEPQGEGPSTEELDVVRNANELPDVPDQLEPLAAPERLSLSGLEDLATDFPSIPSLPIGALVAQLSTSAQERLARLIDGPDSVGVQLEKVVEVASQNAGEIVRDDVFGLDVVPLLPATWAVCFTSPSSPDETCQDGNVPGIEVPIDTNGNDVPDVGVTLTVLTSAETPLSLLNGVGLSLRARRLDDGPITAHVWGAYELPGAPGVTPPRRVRVGWDSYSRPKAGATNRLPNDVTGTVSFSGTAIVGGLDAQATVAGGGQETAAFTFGANDLDAEGVTTNKADASLRLSPVAATTIKYLQTADPIEDTQSVRAEVVNASTPYNLVGFIGTASALDAKSTQTAAEISLVDAPVSITVSRNDIADTAVYEGPAERNISYRQESLKGATVVETVTAGVTDTPTLATLNLRHVAGRTWVTYRADREIERIGFSSVRPLDSVPLEVTSDTLAFSAEDVPKTIDAFAGPCADATCLAGALDDPTTNVIFNVSTDTPLGAGLVTTSDKQHVIRVGVEDLPTFVSGSYDTVTKDFSAQSATTIGRATVVYRVYPLGIAEDEFPNEPQAAPDDFLSVVKRGDSLAIAARVSDFTRVVGHYAAPFTAQLDTTGRNKFEFGYDRREEPGEKDVAVSVATAALPSAVSVRAAIDPVDLTVSASEPLASVRAVMKVGTDLSATYGDQTDTEINAVGVPKWLHADVTDTKINGRRTKTAANYEGREAADGDFAAIDSASLVVRRKPIAPPPANTPAIDEMNVTGEFSAIPGSLRFRLDELTGETSIAADDGALGVADAKVSIRGGEAECDTGCPESEYAALSIYPAFTRTGLDGESESVRAVGAAVRIVGLKSVTVTQPDEVNSNNDRTSLRNATVAIEVEPGGQDVAVNFHRFDWRNPASRQGLFERQRVLGRLEGLPSRAVVAYENVETTDNDIVTERSSAIDARTTGQLEGLEAIVNTRTPNQHPHAEDEAVNAADDTTTAAAALTDLPDHVLADIIDKPTIDARVTGSGSVGSVVLAYAPTWRQTRPIRGDSQYVTAATEDLVLDETDPVRLRVGHEASLPAFCGADPCPHVLYQWDAPASIGHLEIDGHLHLAKVANEPDPNPSAPNWPEEETFLSREVAVDESHRTEDVSLRAEIDTVPKALVVRIASPKAVDATKPEVGAKGYFVESLSGEPIGKILGAFATGPARAATAPDDPSVAAGKFLKVRRSDASNTMSGSSWLEGVRRLSVATAPSVLVVSEIDAADRAILIDVEDRRRAQDTKNDAAKPDDLGSTLEGEIVLPPTLNFAKVAEQDGVESLSFNASEPIRATVKGRFGWLGADEGAQEFLRGVAADTADFRNGIRIAEQTCGYVNPSDEPTEARTPPAGDRCRSTISHGANNDRLSACTKDEDRTWCSATSFSVGGALFKNLSYESGPCEGCATGSIDFGPGERRVGLDLRLRQDVETFPYMVLDVPVPAGGLAAAFGKHPDPFAPLPGGIDGPGGISFSPNGASYSGTRGGCRTDLNVGAKLSAPVSGLTALVGLAGPTMIDSSLSRAKAEQHPELGVQDLSVTDASVGFTFGQLSGGFAARLQSCTDKEIRNAFYATRPLPAHKAIEVWSPQPIDFVQADYAGSLTRRSADIDENGVESNVNSAAGSVSGTARIDDLPAAPFSGKPVRFALLKTPAGATDIDRDGDAPEPHSMEALYYEAFRNDAAFPIFDDHQTQLLPGFEWSSPSAPATGTDLPDVTFHNTFSGDAPDLVDEDSRDGRELDERVDVAVSVRVPDAELAMRDLPQNVTGQLRSRNDGHDPGGIDITTPGSGEIGELSFVADAIIDIKRFGVGGSFTIKGPFGLNVEAAAAGTVTARGAELKFTNLNRLQLRTKAPFLSYAFEGSYDDGYVRAPDSTMALSQPLTVSGFERVTGVHESVELPERTFVLTVAGGYYDRDRVNRFDLNGPVFYVPTSPTQALAAVADACVNSHPRLDVAQNRSLGFAPISSRGWAEFTFLALNESASTLGNDDDLIEKVKRANERINLLVDAVFAGRKDVTDDPKPRVWLSACSNL